MVDIIPLESISWADPSEWDELAGGRIQTSYQWLRLIEKTSAFPVQIRCFLARESGELQAAVFLWRQPQSEGPFNLDVVLLGRLHRAARFLGFSAQRTLISGELFGYGPTILFRNSTTVKEQVRLFSRLLAFIEETACKEGCLLCFRGIAAERHGLTELLSSRGYLSSPELPVCYLDIQWNSFAGYLRSVKSRNPGMAKSIRNEINRGRRGGIIIQRVDNPAPVCTRLHELVDAHYRRLNGRPFPFRPEFFGELKSRLGDRVVLYAATKQERIVGCLVMLCGEDGATLPIIGIDNEYVRRDAVYFNLAYNYPIRDSIEACFRRLYLGRLVYESKLRRGCLLSHTNMYLKAGSRVGDWFLRPILAARSLKLHNAFNRVIDQRA